MKGRRQRQLVPLAYSNLDLCTVEPARLPRMQIARCTAPPRNIVLLTRRDPSIAHRNDADEEGIEPDRKERPRRIKSSDFADCLSLVIHTH